MTTTFTTAQNDRIISALNGVKLANAAIEREQGKREGAYAVLTATALEMDGQTFGEAMADLIDRIRANTDGIARKVGAKKGEKGGWKVPSSVSSAKSVLTGCFEYGVLMLTDEGKPVAFSQLRKDLAAAKQAEADAERQPHEISRDDAIAQAKALIEALQGMDTDIGTFTLTEAVGEALRGMVASIEGDDTEQTEEAATEEAA